jgi:hypothetical protein
VSRVNESEVQGDAENTSALWTQFDGVMLGPPDAPHHLQFTKAHGHLAGRAPTADNLLVFYLRDEREWNDAVARMKKTGYEPASSFNPYWDQHGVTPYSGPCSSETPNRNISLLVF